MKSGYDALYLSPHLDDAALSCGGQIWQQAEAGKRVLVVTITAGDVPAGPLSDFAQELHARWGLAANVVAVRREEDRVACALLGAECRHWEVADCIYRRHPHTGEPLYPAWEAVVGSLHPADGPLVRRLAERLSALPAAGRVYAPLAAGRHVDHQLSRAAAEAWRGDDLRYYEDYPYVREAGALDQLLNPPEGWRPTVIPLRQEAIEARIRAIAAYRSQLSSLFQDSADLEQQVRAYAAATGGERLWQRQPRP